MQTCKFLWYIYKYGIKITSALKTVIIKNGVIIVKLYKNSETRENKTEDHDILKWLKENPEDIDRLLNLQKEIHKAFVKQVEGSRGEQILDKNIFTGEFWVGETAKNLGLIDDIGHLIPTMKKLYGDKTEFYVQEKKKGLISRFGVKIANETIGGLENHANWSKFGL